MTPEQRLPIRFWERVRVMPDDQCWPWVGPLHRSGYGKFTVRYRYYYAHRISWQLAVGPIPEGLCVLHRCDNRRCVRPSHLWLGTYGDNARDMIAKGRGWSGPNAPSKRGEPCVSVR